MFPRAQHLRFVPEPAAVCSTVPNPTKASAARLGPSPARSDLARPAQGFLRAASEEPGDGVVLDGDGRCVAGDHGGTAPAACSLDGGGRGAAPDELRR